MAFFNIPKSNQGIPEKEIPPEQKIDPRLVVIDGNNLIKEITDNSDIKEGKVERYTQHGLVPVNYNPKTGDIL